MWLVTAYDRVVNTLAATGAGTWLVRHVAARADPVVFERTSGRFTLTGRPTLPMLTLTTRGRRTGRLRSVQLAYVEDGQDLVVVASAMGQQSHPAWRYNLEASGRATLQLPGRRVEAVARTIGPEEVDALWPRITEVITPMRTYVRRTERRFVVFRLTPVEDPPGGS